MIIFSYFGVYVIGLPSLRDHAAGLFNLGNTCYSNAVSQCLAHTPLILESLLKKFEPKLINFNNISGGLLLESFAKLLNAIWTEESAIRPISFHAQIGMLEEKFGNYTEQDSMEYLQFLLQQLHNEFNLTCETIPFVEFTDEGLKYWHAYLANENSPIANIFAGQTVSAICCQTCQRTSKNYQSFWDFSLPIPKNKNPSLQDCFAQIFENGVLKDYTCENCHTKESIKTLRVSKWPEIMIIQLIRFSAFEINKIDKMVKCPITLDFSKFGSNTKYNLYAIVNHFGNLNTGHYIAACKHPMSAKWYKYDDNIVTSIESKNVITSNAYILFYQKMQ
ncbi:USP2 [Cordylochernes scorpioides]|uniref:ubiquitinyl hydrolase 1 n=1 Tax=Cordylochernes scorpioides TaxID=51811 RepID=A0ABY6KXV6_9ARAC|nr:USP2 [Cordylochernes scorpioides]